MDHLRFGHGCRALGCRARGSGARGSGARARASRRRGTNGVGRVCMDLFYSPHSEIPSCHPHKPSRFCEGFLVRWSWASLPQPLSVSGKEFRGGAQRGSVMADGGRACGRPHVAKRRVLKRFDERNFRDERRGNGSRTLRTISLRHACLRPRGANRQEPY